MAILSLCKKYLIKHRLPILAFLFLKIVNGLISIYLPYFSGQFIDQLISNQTTDFIVRFAITLLLFGAILIVAGYYSNKIYNKTLLSCNNSFQNDIIEHLNRVRLSFFNTKNANYLAKRIFTDINSVIEFSLSIISNVLLNTIALIVTIFILASINPLYCLVFAVVIVLYCALYLIGRKKLYTLSYENQEEHNKYYAEFCQNIDSAKPIRQHALENLFKQLFKNKYSIMYAKNMKATNFSYLFSSMDTIITLCVQVFIFAIGGLSVINGALTIGKFSMLISYFTMLLNSTKYYFQLAQYYQETKVSADRINDLLSEPIISNGHKELSSIDSITIDNLSFSYNENAIIKNFSCIFSKGSIYGITGSNGAGKSTLFNLIMGLHNDEFLGKIEFDKISINDINTCSFRKKNIDLVEQEAFLIEGTIRDNIILGNAVEDRKLFDVLKILEFDTYVDSLPKGLDTQIEGIIKNLSTGEQQKISILRSILNNKEIVLLDEPTSSLDIASKKQLIEYLKKQKDKRLIVIISHDEQLINECDVTINIGGATNSH